MRCVWRISGRVTAFRIWPNYGLNCGGDVRLSSPLRSSLRSARVRARPPLMMPLS